MINNVMPINFNLKSGSGCQNNSCLTKDGCPTDRCPDFIIKRHDVKPAFKVSIEDCDGPLDFRGLIIEVNMWALAKLKVAINNEIDYFRLADDIGFEQVMVGDIIVMERVRMPEKMLVIGFDEDNKLLHVQRGYHGTTASAWKKGTVLRIFRILNAPAEAEMVLEDQTTPDGVTTEDVITASYLVYEWQPEDTCLPGCYWLEFKVIKMIDMVWYLPGGNWAGDVFQADDGYFYTGISSNDGSVRLSFDQINDYYLIPTSVWTGEIHLWEDDDNWYTGAEHSESSVLLNKTGISSLDSIAYDSEGVVSLAASITPSFTDSDLTPYYFGCILGEGVSSVRRFPISGEGFLIKISPSFTSE